MSLKSLRQFSLLSLLALGALLGSARAARSQEVLTHTAPFGFATYISEFAPPSVAMGFLLSDGPWDLVDIQVYLGGFVWQTGEVNPIHASLWSDSSGLPGAQIAALSLTGGTVSQSDDLLTFSPTGTVTLTANTKYWFVSKFEDVGSIQYRTNGLNANTGAHGINSGIVLGVGDRWFVPDIFPAAMQVRGTSSTVPEPGEWAAMGVLGLALGGLVVRKRRAR